MASSARIVGSSFFMLCFIDESGDLSNYTATGSVYFVCTAVLMYDYEPIGALHSERLAVERDGFPLPVGFHAKNDPYPLRRRIFAILARQRIYIHSVGLRKDQIYNHLRNDEAFVYRIAFRYLVSNLLQRFLADNEEHTIIVSNYAAGKVASKLVEHQRQALAEFGSVHRGTRMGFWDAVSDTGLQMADYCSWMIQRHLEAPAEKQAIEFKNLMDTHVASLYLPFK